MRNQICTRFARALSSLGQPFLAKGLGRIGSNCISQSSLLSRRARGCRNFSLLKFRYDKNITNAIEPPIKISILNFSGTTNWLTTSAMKIYLLKSRNTLAKFSLCRFVNFTDFILHQIKFFVKKFSCYSKEEKNRWGCLPHLLSEKN